MRKFAKYSIIVILQLLLTFCSSNKKLTDSSVVILPLSDTVRVTDGSIVYALPRTVVTVNVEMEHTIEVPGPYSRFAGELLGLSNVILSENESWDISSVSLTSHEEIDPSEYYIIKSTSLFQSNVLTLKKEGLILDMNPSVFNYGKEAGTGSNQKNFRYTAYDLGSDEYFQSQSDTAYRRVAVDSSFVRIPYIVEKKKKLTIDQMAEKAAKRLMEMREGKHLILTGEATVFPQSEAAINEMNRLEKEYLELFTGKTFTETRKFSFQLIPEKEISGKPATLFFYSETSAPVQKSTTGKPVTATFTPESKTKDLTVVTGSNSSQQNVSYDKLYYRVPDVVNVKIASGDEVLVNKRMLIYQFGELVQLPANYIIGK